MTSAVFFSFLASLSICMALIPLLQLNAGRWQLLDVPGGRKVHANPTPRIGGIAFGFAAVVSISVWGTHEQVVLPMLMSVLVIMGFGIWDDRVGLTYKIKLVGQLLASLVLVVYGQLHFDQVPFLFEQDAPLWLSIPLTILFLVGAANAVNLSDGLDGLAGGLAFLSFAGIAYLAYMSHDLTVLISTSAFLGGLLGFLRYNTYPARIFMGDAGSQLLGFSMGTLVLLLIEPSRAPFPMTVGLLVLGLPFLDTIAVMGQRLAKGRSPFIGDRNHVHHKLLALGLSHYQAVIVIYGIQAVMVGLAYILRWHSDALILTVYSSFAVAMFTLFFAAERRGIQFVDSEGVNALSDTKLAHTEIWLSVMAPRFLAVMVPVFLIANVFLPGRVPIDVGSAALILSGIVLTGQWLLPQYRSHFVRGGLYVGSAFLMYISEQSGVPEIWPIYVTQNTVLAIIAILVLLSMRFSRGNPFQTTPLDYLMVFFALIVPLLPEMRADMPTLSILAAKLIVLYFSFELLLHTFTGWVKQFGLVSLWVLLGLGARAWL